MTTLKEALDQLAKGHELDNEQKKLIIDKWQKELGIQPCEDAISREDAMSMILCYGNEIKAEVMDDIKASMIKLPPVTPKESKTGHWITTRTFMHDGEYYCDKCKCDALNNEKWNYCPNCGAKMESEET